MVLNQESGACLIGSSESEFTLYIAYTYIDTELYRYQSLFESPALIDGWRDRTHTHKYKRTQQTILCTANLKAAAVETRENI